MRKLVSWDDLCKVLSQLGYTQKKPGQRGGSGVPFQLPDGTVRNFHRPHNGIELRGKTMARRLGIPLDRFWELSE